MNMVLVIAILIIGTTAYIMFKTQLGALARGFMSLMVKDIAQTPEGAEIIYTKAINEKQHEYNKASYTLQQITGTLALEKSKFQSLKVSFEETEKKCESCVNAGNMERARILASERQGILREMDSCTQNMENLEQAVREAKEVVDIFEEQLGRLKREMRQVITDLKVGEQLANAYNSLDGLKNSDGLSDLIDTVKDGAKEKKARARGARIVHESKLSSGFKPFDEKMNDKALEDYLEGLKRKADISEQDAL